MILVLKKSITPEQKERLNQELRTENCIIKEIKGVEETILGVVGKISKDIRYYETLPGVSKAIPISKPYKLVSRELRHESSVVMVKDVAIGGDRLVVIAGPCGVEDRNRTLDIARVVRKHGAVLFRGGAFKPRTSPYSFQGLGGEGLKILAEVREETGLGIVTEIFAQKQINIVKLESRPNPSKPWQYLFYMDLEMDLDHENNQGILEALRDKTEFFKLLGNYQKGPQAIT
jgi:3-deoxy-7-phosphoheptulonate synthase